MKIENPYDKKIKQLKKDIAIYEKFNIKHYDRIKELFIKVGYNRFSKILNSTFNYSIYFNAVNNIENELLVKPLSRKELKKILREIKEEAVLIDINQDELKLLKTDLIDAEISKSELEYIKCRN